MDSEDYLQQTGMLETLERLLDTDDRAVLWGLGAEFILLAAMKGETEFLGEMAVSSTYLENIINKSRSPEPATYQPSRPGEEIAALINQPATIGRSCRSMIEQAKTSIAAYQSVPLGHFLEQHLNNRGESVESFNKRLFRTTVLPSISPYAAEVRRTQGKAGRFEFQINGKLLPDWQYDTVAQEALTDLHSAQLEFDTFTSLYHLVINKKLPFIPILSGPAGEKLSFAAENNMNADILLMRADAHSVIPVQVKTRSTVKHGYADWMVMVDSLVLGSWDMQRSTEKNEKGLSSTIQKSVLIAGRATVAACKAYSRPQMSKNSAALRVVDRTAERLYQHLADNPLHKFAPASR